MEFVSKFVHEAFLLDSTHNHRIKFVRVSDWVPSKSSTSEFSISLIVNSPDAPYLNPPNFVFVFFLFIQEFFFKFLMEIFQTFNWGTPGAHSGNPSGLLGEIPELNNLFKL